MSKSSPKPSPKPSSAPPAMGLQTLMAEAQRAARSKGLPPVHLWNPPDCGDIGMKILSDGTWIYGGTPIGRMALVRLFSSILRLDADGVHYLVTPVEKIPIAVEDAPFQAVLMTARGKGAQQQLYFETNVGDMVEANDEHRLEFRMDKRDAPRPYVMVRAGLMARLARPVFYQLVDLGCEHRGQFGVWSGGVFFSMMAAERLRS